MTSVVIDKPYEFIPPHSGSWWPKTLQRFLPWHLNRTFGIESVDCTGLEHLRESLRAGHGVMIAANHCRPSDPSVVNEVCRQAGTPAFTMASWHVFMDGAIKRFVLRRIGGFSVYREGSDRTALKVSIEMLENAQRPLVIFPEGVITRANDRLLSLMDGVAFIANAAAKKRHKRDGGSVVVHPVAIRYHFQGDPEPQLQETLSKIESKLSWRSQEHHTLVDRIYRVGNALLTLKEIEYMGKAHEGTFHERGLRLINHMLGPSEQEWLGPHAEAATSKPIVARVKQLRSTILKDMVEGDLGDVERKRRWDQLDTMHLAQQFSHYPPEYVRRHPTPMRMMETIERFEEDLTGTSRIYRPMKAEIKVGQAILVDPSRRGKDDPLMPNIRQSLRELLGID